MYLVIAALLIGYLGICVLMFVFQRSLLYFPQPRSVKAPESTLRLPVEGAELVVTLRARGGPKALVYFGGNGEDVSLNLASFAAAFPDHALYLMHYRGYGGSSGQPTEASNVADGLALFGKVRAQHAEVALMGRSLGSGVAVQVAARTDAKRLVLITPYDSIVGIAAQLYPALPVRWLMRDTYASGQFAAGIQIPTTLIEAEHDTVIPHASTAQLLARFAPGVAHRVLIEGAGHNDLEFSPKYLDTLQAALR